jgi:hypothetical protein
VLQRKPHSRGTTTLSAVMTIRFQPICLRLIKRRY